MRDIPWEIVYSYFTLKDIVQTRLVCKEWDKRLLSDDFHLCSVYYYVRCNLRTINDFSKEYMKKLSHHVHLLLPNSNHGTPIAGVLWRSWNNQNGPPPLDSSSIHMLQLNDPFYDWMFFQCKNLYRLDLLCERVINIDEYCRLFPTLQELRLTFNTSLRDDIPSMLHQIPSTIQRLVITIEDDYDPFDMEEKKKDVYILSIRDLQHLKLQGLILTGSIQVEHGEVLKSFSSLVYLNIKHVENMELPTSLQILHTTYETLKFNRTKTYSSLLVLEIIGYTSVDIDDLPLCPRLLSLNLYGNTLLHIKHVKAHFPKLRYLYVVDTTIPLSELDVKFNGNELERIKLYTQRVAEYEKYLRNLGLCVCGPLTPEKTPFQIRAMNYNVLRIISGMRFPT